MRRVNSKGFTIIELLIATAAFSVVLLTISAAIVQIGRLYYKGITSARTQQASRSVMDSIVQTLQFDSGDFKGGIDLNNPAGPVTFGTNQALCVGTKHFSYALGKQQSPTQHALVVQTIPAGCSGVVGQNLSGAVNGTELLGEHMRLAKLDVTPIGATGTSYSVTIRVVYGDDDLLCDPGVATGHKSCIATDSMTPQEIAATPNLSCKNLRSGTQFCSASELSTIVNRRMQ